MITAENTASAITFSLLTIILIVLSVFAFRRYDGIGWATLLLAVAFSGGAIYYILRLLGWP